MRARTSTAARTLLSSPRHGYPDLRRSSLLVYSLIIACCCTVPALGEPGANLPDPGSCSNNAPPVAAASGDIAGVTGVPVSFDGSASWDADGDLLGYHWSFGDGEWQDWQESPASQHTFSDPGTYAVKLWVLDDCGLISTRDAFEVVISDPDPCLNNQPPEAVAGDDQVGEPGDSFAFDGSASNDPDGQIASYHWDFGDGSTATGAQVNHSYDAAGVYAVTLTVSDACGDSDSDELLVEVANPCANNVAPFAEAGDDQAGEPGDLFSFDGSASYDSDGALASYHWDLGDGNTAEGAVVSHAYDAAGDYTVTLTVTDNCGGQDSDALAVTVEDPPCANNAPPVADAGPNAAGDAGVALSFNGSGSYDPDGSVTAWQWDFGDGQTASGAAVSHTFAAAGTYTVQLTVTDDCGASASDTLVATVQGGAPQPLQANFQAFRLAGIDPVSGLENWVEIDLEQESVELGLEVKFDASSSTGPAAYYTWYFSDGTWAQGVEVSRAFTQSDLYTARLTVDSADWMQSDSETRPVDIADGMQQLSIMPWLGQSYQPRSFDLLGSDLWVLTMSGMLGVADASDPANLGPITTLVSSGLSSASQVVASDGRVFVAKEAQGVSVYNADAANFGWLGDALPGDAGVTSALYVQAVGDLLLVAAGGPDTLLLYDVSGLNDPASPGSPSLVGQLPLPDGIEGMWLVGDEAVAVLGHPATTVSVIDVRNPAAPSVVEALDFATTLTVRALDDLLFVCRTGHTNVWQLEVPADPSDDLNLAPQASLNVGLLPLARSADRLYVKYGTRVAKYAWPAPTAEPYYMEEVDPTGAGLYGATLFDPDGPSGPALPALLVGISSSGFEAYTP